ncbi:MAG: hypothetical protein F6K31_32765 [Symploca sp. SIO2G7]|nr:hypothetical protein [Symploca sp. SIO2G7]
MKIFGCACGRTVYFENTHCLRCDRTLGFLPDRLELSALEPLSGHCWRALSKGAEYRQCQNYWQNDACNWMVAHDDPHEYCLACRLNEVIPNLSKPGNRALWLRIERRKRRLVYELRSQKLPVFNREVDAERGLGFAFLEDGSGELEFRHSHQGRHIVTGHANGLITINIAEADDVERERMRVKMNEQQRTLLGHFRHESGHYYWDLLVKDGPLLNSVREVFGDERADYSAALQRYYQHGPPHGWQQHWVSAYASAHSWEDWAECWAHWLQINDTLETAVAIGLAPADALVQPIDARLNHWMQLAVHINLLNRSLDQPDPYPFVLTPSVIAKLKLVDEVIGLSGFTP